jgi:hypothetical protein
VHAIRIGLRDPQAGIDPCLIVLHGRNVTSQCGVRRKYAEEGAYQEKENPPDFPAMCRNTPPNLDYLNLELSPGVEVASGKRGICRISTCTPLFPGKYKVSPNDTGDCHAYAQMAFRNGLTEPRFWLDCPSRMEAFLIPCTISS